MIWLLIVLLVYVVGIGASMFFERKPFIYRNPEREVVTLGYDGNYVHLECVEFPRED